MTSFEFFTVALSLVLGLGLSRLLLGGIYVFRARRKEAPHWIPLLWALGLFLLQIQFWWAIFELQDLMTTWTLGRFAALLAGTVILFIAGALILPSTSDPDRETLLDYFQRDGRWALIAMIAYGGLSLWLNWLFWNDSPIGWNGAFVMLFAITAIGGFLSKSKVLLGWLTVAFFLEMIYAFIAFAPTEY